MRLWWLAVVPVAGCGVLSGLDGLRVTDGGGPDVIGQEADTDAADDGGASDVAIDIGTSCEAGTCNSPAGFQPVLFTEGTGTCPQGTTSLDVVTDPSPPANACVCACSFAPACVPQPLVFGTGNTCTVAVSGNATLDGGCNQGNNQNVPAHVAVGPFAPTNSCSNVLTKNGPANSRPARICGISDCSSCTAPPGFQVCFAESGDVSCPSKMTKHSVGVGASLSCTQCSACSSTAKCKGTLDIYNDFSCGFSSDTITVDGTCQATNANFLASLKYTPNIDQGTCTAGTSDASVSLGALTTVCCP